MQVSVTACGQGWTSTRAGQQQITVHNTDYRAGEAQLINPRTGAVYADVEPIGPGTSDSLRVSLSAGAYAWRCLMEDEPAITGTTVHLTGAAHGTTPGVVPVSQADLIPATRAYERYVRAQLPRLITLTDTLRADIVAGERVRARQDWLPAHLLYERLGAAYDAFGDLDSAINGLPNGLPGGVHDAKWTGFHRLEYGLWHGEAAATLAPVADQLDGDVHGLVGDWPKQDFDPADLPLRAHEILENTLQFQLTGDADYGSGTTLATADANLAGTREVLSVIRPLIQARDPRGLKQIDAWLDRFGTAVDGAKKPDGTWTPVDQLDTATRQKLNGTLGELLEQLSVVPDLLEIRKAT